MRPVIDARHCRHATMDLAALARMWLTLPQPAPLRSPLPVILRRAEVTEVLGGWDQALAEYRRCREIAGRTGEPARVAEIDLALAALLSDRGEFSQAAPLLDEAATIYGGNGDRRGLCRTWGGRGNVCYCLGQNAEAIGHYQRVLVASEELGDQRMICSALGSIGRVQTIEKDYAAAHAHLARCLELALAVGDKRSIGIVYGCLGNLCRDQLDFDRADEWYRRYLEIAAEMGDVHNQGFLLISLGKLEAARGCHQQAVTHGQEALRISEMLGNRRGILSALQILGGSHASLGNCRLAENFHRRIAELEHPPAR